LFEIEFVGRSSPFAVFIQRTLRWLALLLSGRKTSRDARKTGIGNVESGSDIRRIHRGRTKERACGCWCFV
jgi:hypothetical protein